MLALLLSSIALATAVAIAIGIKHTLCSIHKIASELNSSVDVLISDHTATSIAPSVEPTASDHLPTAVCRQEPTATEIIATEQRDETAAAGEKPADVVFPATHMSCITLRANPAVGIDGRDLTMQTEEVMGEGLAWRLEMRVYTWEGAEYLMGTVRAHNHGSIMWKCKAEVSFRILKAPSRFGFDVTSKEDAKFDYSSASCERRIVKKSYLMDPESFFVESGKIDVEVKIQVISVSGVRQITLFDYFSPLPNQLSDVILVVDEQRFHVNKAILSLHSRFFEKLFFGDFAEKGKAVVQLGAVTAENFTDLLDQVFPSNKEITKTTVQKILELAHRYDMQDVLSKCESFLIDTSTVDTVQKLLYADEYGFLKLESRSLAKLDSVAAVRKLERRSKFAQLNPKTQVKVLRKLLDFTEDESD